MRVLAINGSHRCCGATAAAMGELIATLCADEVHTYRADQLKIAPCVGCEYCRSHEGCSQKDDMQPLIEQICQSDVIVIGSPIYFGNLSGQLKTLCDRLYPAYRGGGKSLFSGKKLYLIYTQHSPCDTYADFRKTAVDYLFGFLGFDLVSTTVVGADGKKVFCK